MATSSARLYFLLDELSRAVKNRRGGRVTAEIRVRSLGTPRNL